MDVFVWDVANGCEDDFAGGSAAGILIHIHKRTSGFIWFHVSSTQRSSEGRLQFGSLKKQKMEDRICITFPGWKWASKKRCYLEGALL
jgi:hypothetical protein